MGYARVSCFSNGGELDVFNGWRGEAGCARVGWFSMGRGPGVSSGRQGGLRYALAEWFSHGRGSNRKKAPLIDNQLLPSAICFCDLDQQIDATLTNRLHVVYINCDRFICAQALKLVQWVIAPTSIMP